MRTAQKRKNKRKQNKNRVPQRNGPGKIHEGSPRGRCETTGSSICETCSKPRMKEKVMDELTVVNQKRK